VCDKSSAASISSRMYIGAGLNCSSAMINDSAMSDLLSHICVVRRWGGNQLGTQTYRWPPLSSVKLCFQTLPSWTLISKPSIKSWLSGGCNFEKFPGRSSAKMPPKSLDRQSQPKLDNARSRVDNLRASSPVHLLPRRLQGVALVPV
jgi:hypothetical protein